MHVRFNLARASYEQLSELFKAAWAFFFFLIGIFICLYSGRASDEAVKANKAVKATLLQVSRFSNYTKGDSELILVP